MKRNILSSLCAVVVAAVTGVSTVQAQTHATDFTEEPDKSMAAAHESFLKGDMNKASDQISKPITASATQNRRLFRVEFTGVLSSRSRLPRLYQGS